MEFLLNPLISKEEWNKFVAENHGSFLQCYEWGNFQQMSGRDVTRAVVKDGGRIVLLAQIFKYVLPMGKSYIYIPYGPVFELAPEANHREQAKVFDFFITELRKLANKESGIIFLKIEMDCALPEAKSSYGDLVSVGFKKSTKDIQARETMIVDLTLSEDNMLARMKQKTRYNIKLAQKHGVKIIRLDSARRLPEKSLSSRNSAIESEARSDDEAVSACGIQRGRATQSQPQAQNWNRKWIFQAVSYMDPKIFVSLLEETAKRNGFRTHGQKYYLDMMDLFLGKPALPGANALSQKLYFAYYAGEIIAAALVGFFGCRATFLHGASASRHRNVMAPYLLHWEIMREAKRLGFSEYDFWGIVTPRTDQKQARKWLGFSRFKEGFGGRVVEYPGAYDLVFNKMWYNAYRIIRRFKM